MNGPKASRPKEGSRGVNLDSEPVTGADSRPWTSRGSREFRGIESVPPLTNVLTPHAMRYFIRNDRDAKVEGPFTLEALTEAIRVGRIPAHAMASSDLGDDIRNLQAWRRCDWFPLASIPELRGVVPPLPAPVSDPSRSFFFAVTGFGILTLSYAYRGVTERRWILGLLAVASGYVLVDTILRYARRRRGRSGDV